MSRGWVDCPRWGDGSEIDILGIVSDAVNHLKDQNRNTILEGAKILIHPLAMTALKMQLDPFTILDLTVTDSESRFDGVPIEVTESVYPLMVIPAPLNLEAAP